MNSQGQTWKDKPHMENSIQRQRTYYFIVRTLTHVTSVFVFKSFSCEPDMVKESVSASSSPSENRKRRKK